MADEAKKEPEAPKVEAPLPPAQYGQFLKEHGISTERLPDSCGVGNNFAQW